MVKIAISTKSNEEKPRAFFYLSKKIIEAYRNNGFVSIVVFGKQGSGKTTFAFKLMRDVYYELNKDKFKDKNEAWKEVEKYYFFELPEALKLIKVAIETGGRIPVLLFDDASIWLSKYQWREKYMILFYQLYALIRLRVSAIIFTTPGPDDIAKFIREKGWYYVRIKWENKKAKEAEGIVYKKVFTKDSRGNIVSKFKEIAVEFYKVELPNDFYQRYVEKRRQTEQKLIEKLEQILAQITENEGVNNAS